MLQTKISNLLKEIQSGELEWAYYYVTQKAVEWTICGFVNEGIKLLEILWSFGIEHTRNVWLPDEGLQIMWMVAGSQPSQIPFQFKNVEEIENENWRRCFYPDEEFIRKVLASKNQQNRERVFEEMESLTASPDSVGSRLFHNSCAASLFACKCGDLRRAEHFIKVWGEGYKKYPSNYSLPQLMRDRSSASVLLKGFLAPVFEVSKESCKTETQQIKDALETRISQGRSLVYGKQPWIELLKEMSALAIEQNTYDFSQRQINEKWLGYKNASDKQIKNAENRLGIELPGEYKEFLRASNGLACLSTIDVTLMPVEEINYLKVLDKELVDIWTGESDREEFNQQFSSSILIGGYHEEQQLLLVPISDNKWECWFFAYWSPGETKYPSFRFYMERVLTRLKEGFFQS